MILKENDSMDHPLRILLAEDDHDDIFLFREALGQLPYSVNLQIAEDGEQLIEVMTASDIPNFIFLDLNMPRKDGYDCLHYIRSAEKNRQIIVVIMSTSSNKESVERAYNGGANLYVKKPDSFSELIHVISTCLQKKDSYPEKPSREDFFLLV